MLISAVSLHGQTPPDMAHIEQEIGQPESPYYYPLLMLRYEKADTTLTQTDYHYLYYGYPFQDTYRPLLQSSWVDSLSMSFSGRGGQNYVSVARYCYEILREEPFNLRDINALSYALVRMGEKEQAAAQMRKIDMISRVIRASGTGLTEESPWWITYMNHAQDILNLSGADPLKAIVVSSTVEFVPCRMTPNKSIKGYYFNYSEVYKRKPTYLNDVPKTKRKLEFNPLYNPKSKQNILKK